MTRKPRLGTTFYKTIDYLNDFTDRLNQAIRYQDRKIIHDVGRSGSWGKYNNYYTYTITISAIQPFTIIINVECPDFFDRTKDYFDSYMVSVYSKELRIDESWTIYSSDTIADCFSYLKSELSDAVERIKELHETFYIADIFASCI